MLCRASCPFGPEKGLNFSPNSSSTSSIPVLFSLACLSAVIGAMGSVDILLRSENLRLTSKTSLAVTSALMGLPLVPALVRLIRSSSGLLPAQRNFAEGIRP